MENAPELREAGAAGAAGAAVSARSGEPAEQTPPVGPATAPEKTEESGRGGGGGADLSSINAMMSAVMSATGRINGDAGSDVAPGASPSPSSDKTSTAGRAASGRNVRRSQDAKDERGAHVCPLCDKSCQSQHQLTMHIRQHNVDAGATDHSCSICGKCLSSASSLDRHMLVHSGERPYKCSVCAQTFTTNGNMHRHMKIHEKDPAGGLLPVSPPSPTKRRRPSVKRRQDPEDEDGEEPPAKKVTEESPSEEATAGAPTTPAAGDGAALPCPICFRSCVGRAELDAHMDTHPDSALRCDRCCLSFRTHRGLLRHNAGIHRILPRDPGGRPFIQTNPSIPAGFNDLAFIDFSCKKFARIAQVWCETNLRRCVGKFHRFVCERCDKAFPLRSALDLHKSRGHSPAAGDAPNAAPEDVPLSPRDRFMEALGLRHVSKVTLPPTEDEIHQAHLDSIKAIHVEPLSCSLPQEPAFPPAGAGGPAAPGGPPSDRTSTLQGLSQRDALGLLSLQPFQAGFLLQPDGGGAATAGGGGSAFKPGEAAGVLELADIRRVLKAAAAAADRSGPAFTGPEAASSEAEPPLTASTPPPLRSSQRASLGHAGPGSPSSDSPPAGTGGKGAAAGGEAEGSFPCRFCDRVFSFSGVLQAHMRFHLGILPHQCNICDYVAPDKATLIRHLRTHSGERPYICRVCHYPFTVKANCERHLRKKHGKTSRKDIEKHIKCVFSAEPGVSGEARAGPGAEAACRFCGQDLKTYRALQIHLRTHNGCQRKPFECRRCGAAFLAKRNCIHHLLKQHPEVQEREIEEHIAATAARLPAAGRVKTEDYGARDPDQPLDFSAKGRGAPAVVKAEVASPLSETPSPDQPVDLSIPGKRLWREEAEKRRLKPEQNGNAPPRRDKTAAAAPAPAPSPPGGLRLAPGLPPGTLPRPQRLKPLLPKPTSIKELPPLASIAQIIHSVSAAPDLLKREAVAPGEADRQPTSRSPCDPPGGTAVPQVPRDDGARKKNGKKNAHELLPVLGGAAVDLESSGEFASVEKMLATTDANKFTNFLQTEDVTSETPAGDGRRALADKEAAPRDRGKATAGATAPPPPSKGKKNAYSNSVQKMTCPFCPRVFPWASSLQRHMLTHTGQKPFPCPRCDAFFSTKSNCERHLLRKHGVTNRTLRRNGALATKESDDGSPESAGSQSDAEPPADERTVAAAPATTPLPDVPPKGEELVPSGPAVSLPAPTCELRSRQAEDDAFREAGRPAPDAAECRRDEHVDEDEDEDDCRSDKSLDLNFGSKLIDFKLSDSAGAAPEGASDRRHVCGTCRKGFRYATTLARHEKAHPSREAAPDDDHGGDEEGPDGGLEPAAERSDAPESEDDDDKDERGDDEVESPEGDEEAECPEGDDEAKSPDSRDGAVADKRKKKTCVVCAKRFWSLQDLTRHMRSHTGERPYRCATCERTFTLKHSLVRHQRIHANKTAGEDGIARPPSENENESAKDSDDGRAKESDDGRANDSDDGRAKDLDDSRAKDSDDGRASDPEAAGRTDAVSPEPPDGADREPPPAGAD